MLSIPPMSTKIARGPYLMDAIRNLGYANSSLKLVLDAADPDSMVPSQLVSGNQYWKDRSGNGNNYTIGNFNTTDGTEPSWSGSDGVNVTGNEYFYSNDGHDYFRYNNSVTSESWMQDLAKPGSGTIAITAYIASNSEDTNLLSTGIDGDAASLGIDLSYRPTYNSFVVGAWNVNTGPSYIYVQISGISGSTPPVPSLSTYVVSWNFPNTSFLQMSAYLNGNAGPGSTVSPGIAWSSNSSAVPLHLMTKPGHDSPAGTRLYSLAVWQGAKLSNTEVAALGSAMRARYT